MLRVVWGVVLLSVVATGVATAGGGPLADAGLDQTVDQHSRVYLDAGGSVAPDGDIASYEWVIERPDGSTMEPDCATCAQTSFVADAAGEYAVTVTVTDDSGATASDTLYVTVRAVDPPTATLRGPTTVERGDSVTYELDGETGDRDLAAYELAVDGDRVARTVVDDGSPREMSVTFSETGERPVTGTVVGERGLTGRDTLTVEVTETGCGDGRCNPDVDSPFSNDGGGGPGTAGPVAPDVAIYEGPDGNQQVEISAPGAALDPDGTTTFTQDGTTYTIDNAEYNRKQRDLEGDSISKEYDVDASDVLATGSSDELKNDALDDGEEVQSLGNDVGSDETVVESTVDAGDYNYGEDGSITGVDNGDSDSERGTNGFDHITAGYDDDPSGVISDSMQDELDAVYGGGGGGPSYIGGGGSYTGGF